MFFVKIRSIRIEPVFWRPAVLLLLAGVISGCQSGKTAHDKMWHSLRDYRQAEPVVFTQTTENISFFVQDHSTGLSSSGKAAAREFAALAKKNMAALYILPPSDEESTEKSDHLISELQAALKDADAGKAKVVSDEKINGLGSKPGVIMLVRAEIGPRARYCPERPERDETESLLGCALHSNIAAIVSNPEDLLRPRAKTPTDAKKTYNIIEEYQQPSKESSSDSFF